MKRRGILYIIIIILLIGGARLWLQPRMPAPDKIVKIISDEPSSSGVLDDAQYGPDAVVTDKVLATVDDFVTPRVPSPQGATIYTLPTASTLGWLGSRVAGDQRGTIGISSGSARVRDGKLIGGTIVLDMKSIRAENDPDQSLALHLQAEDFFAAEQYPVAIFVLTKVDGTQITGVLKIKDVVKTITFPATLIVEDDSVFITADFAFDRKQRGVNGGGTMISQFVELIFNLRFAR